MKHLTHQLSYPTTTVEAVSAMLADPAFREEVGRAQGVRRQRVTVRPEGVGRIVELEQVQATSGVPGFAQRIVGDETTVLTVERWSSPTAATVDVTIPGKPGTMTGSVVLADSGETVTQTVELDVTVTVPLLGGSVEQLLVDLMTKAYRAENRVGREWLAR